MSTKEQNLLSAIRAVMEGKGIRIGQRVTCNGFAGTVTAIHTDLARAGLVDVRLERGTVTVDADDLEPA